MGVTLDDTERRRLRNLKDHAEEIATRLDEAAFGYKKGRDDGHQDKLIEARDTARRLGKQIESVTG